MFSNQINFRELFSNPSSVIHGARNNPEYNDSTGSQNNSQVQFSQSEYPDSQDFSSQQLSSQSNMNSTSPGRKLYNRSLGKHPAPWEKQHGSSNSRGQVPLYKMTTQQLQNNISRAKERDERDILNSLVNTVRESMADVLATVGMLKDNMERSTETSAEGIGSCLMRIQDTIQKQHSDMNKALETRDAHKEEVTKLRKELTYKDSTLLELRDEVKTLRENHESALTQAMDHFCQEGHQQTCETFTKMYGQLIKQMADDAKKQTKEQSDMLKELHQCRDDLLKSHKSSTKDIQSKFSAEIKQAQHSEKEEMKKLLKDIKECIKGIQKQQKEELDKLFKRHVQQLQTSKAFQETDETVLLDQLKGLKDISVKHKHDIILKVEEKLQNFTVEHQNTLRELLLETLTSQVEKLSDTQLRQFKEATEESCSRQLDQIKDIKDTFKDDVNKLFATLPKDSPLNRADLRQTESMEHEKDDSDRRHSLRPKRGNAASDAPPKSAAPFLPQPLDGAKKENIYLKRIMRDEASPVPSRQLRRRTEGGKTESRSERTPGNGQHVRVSPLVSSHHAWNAAIPIAMGRSASSLPYEYRPSPVAAVTPFVHEAAEPVARAGGRHQEQGAAQSGCGGRAVSQQVEDYESLQDLQSDEIEESNRTEYAEHDGAKEKAATKRKKTTPAKKKTTKKTKKTVKAVSTNVEGVTNPEEKVSVESPDDGILLPTRFEGRFRKTYENTTATLGAVYGDRPPWQGQPPPPSRPKISLNNVPRETFSCSDRPQRVITTNQRYPLSRQSIDSLATRQTQDIYQFDDENNERNHGCARPIRPTASTMALPQGGKTASEQRWQTALQAPTTERDFHKEYNQYCRQEEDYSSHNQLLMENSSPGGQTSQESSPSMSVTEFFVTRRIRQKPCADVSEVYMEEDMSRGNALTAGTGMEPNHYGPRPRTGRFSNHDSGSVFATEVITTQSYRQLRNNRV